MAILSECRSPRPIAIARGPHACLGIHLARLEAKAAVDAVLDGLTGVMLESGQDEGARGLIFRAPPAVHARWDVA